MYVVDYLFPDIKYLNINWNCAFNNIYKQDKTLLTMSLDN
jgi:hypothetical protein